MADPTSTSVTTRRHPKIHLLTYHKKDLAIFREARETYPLPSSYSISYHTNSLRSLDPSVHFDAVVSPANSFGLMDGGFDDMLSQLFSPKGDYYGLTRVVQEKLWNEWKGFAPPGTCTLVPFKFSSYGSQPATSRKKVPWGCRIIAVCPTMRVPQDARWDREIIYECTWSLLCAIDKWNAACEDGEQINSILMTPLATGVGGVSARRWASQVLLALRHFDEACANKDQWTQLTMEKAVDLSEEIVPTHKM